MGNNDPESNSSVQRKIQQISQNYKTGRIKLEKVASPAMKHGGVLVKTNCSVISLGTESMKVREGKMSYLEKARARPDQVKKVVKSVQQHGLASTLNKVISKLDSLSPLGYSLSGTVVAVAEGVDEFSIGQRVACAGAGYAVHSEENYLPRNLVVPVPDCVPMQQAAFATVGAIAMQGYRQSRIQLGETACVIGLGLLGQLLVQILKAAGMNVIGIDIDTSRCALAKELGADISLLPDDPTLRQAVKRFSGNYGVDCVYITAGGKSNMPVELAIELARDRGHIVDVGKTKLELDWNNCYMKELDLSFSRSYGPGRYDPNYEEKGVDYPIGYVRWTERRNMAAFLDLIANKQINLEPLITAVFPFEQAEEVYQKIADGTLSDIGIVFNYPQADKPQSYTIESRSVKPRILRGVRIGAIGAGNYALSMLFPALEKTKDVTFIAVSTATGMSAENAARKYPFERTGTDYKALLQAKDIDAVVIATRHASHAGIVVEALHAQKAVFVEKPLSIDLAGLEKVRQELVNSENDRLQVGFNRRFAPLVQRLRETFSSCGQPLMMSYRVHAGQMDAGSWYLDPEQGTRFIGEAGHFIDVFAYLTGANPVSVMAYALSPEKATSDDRENMAVVINYDDGSVANLLYLTQGGSKLPKEYLEVHGGGMSAQLDNFQKLIIYQGMRQKRYSASLDKGQNGQMEAFINAIQTGNDMPIHAQSLIDTTLATLAAQASRIQQRAIRLAEFWDD